MMLNNYDFNHTENNNEMENETNTYQPLTPSGSHNNNKKNPKNSKKLAKKIGHFKCCFIWFCRCRFFPGCKLLFTCFKNNRQLRFNYIKQQFKHQFIKNNCCFRKFKHRQFRCL